MALEDQHAKLMAEAQALKHFYNTESDALREAFAAFAAKYESTDDVHSDEFYAALNDINNEIEDLCISKRISQESLEELMEADSSYEDIVL